MTDSDVAGHLTSSSGFCGHTNILTAHKDTHTLKKKVQPSHELLHVLRSVFCTCPLESLYWKENPQQSLEKWGPGRDDYVMGHRPWQWINALITGMD